MITEILRGRRAATLDEASRLAAVLDLEPAQLRRAVHLPAALVHAVERPVHGLAIRARAAAASITEAAARLLVAEGVVATPARTTATERDVELDTVIHDVFFDQLDGGVRLEEDVCDAIAGQLLIPDERVANFIGPAGPTARAVVDLIEASPNSSREACCVRDSWSAVKCRRPMLVACTTFTVLLLPEPEITGDCSVAGSFDFGPPPVIKTWDQLVRHHLDG